MNPKQDYIERQKKICREEWFKEHTAVFIDMPTNGNVGEFKGATIISWQNPASWNYGCRFIIHRRWLCVVGDIGEAVYEWGHGLTLEFLGGLDFHYFHSKCRSSESGSDFEMWEGEFCVPVLKEFLEWNLDWGTEKKKEILEEAERYTSCKEEWVDFIYRSEHKFGDDDYSLADAGSVPHARCIGHFIGVQMAIEQLTKKP